MLIAAYYEEIPKYKDYKNRTVAKHIDKIKNQLRQIKDCSLKQDDKVALKKVMSDLINMKCST